MKIERIIYDFAASCFVVAVVTVATVSPAMSQVNKEVEVTQAFIPQVMPATKPELLPKMDDDAYINPDIDYSITPRSIHTEIDTTPYKPVEMDYWEYNRQKNYYAKLGFGLPLSTVANLYASKSNTRGYVVGYVNYEGEYADIENDYGVMSDAAQSHLRIGSTAGLYVGHRVLESSLKYTNDMWSRYATEVDSDEHPLYQRLGLDLRFGDSFSDMSRWNFSLDGGVEQMWSRSDYENTIFESRVDLGRKIGVLDVVMSALYDYVGGSDNYKHSTFGAALMFGVRGEKAKLNLGVDYYNDDISFDSSAANVAYSIDGGVKNIFIPRFEFDYQPTSTRAILFLNFDGELLRNDFSALSDRNQYVVEGLFGSTSSVEYDISFGLKGSVADRRLGYNFSGHYTIVTNKIYWALEESYISSSSKVNNSFVGSMSNQECLSLVVESEYRPNSNLKFDIEAVWANYMDDNDQPWANGEADLRLRVGGEYRAKAIGFRVNCEVLSSREFSLLYGGQYSSYYSTLTSVEIPCTVNLSASADYRIKSDCMIFCEVSNILNDDLYQWVGYREYGIGAMVGVKFKF